MKRSPHVPLRTCVACRQTRPKAELLRVVRTMTGEIVPDATGKAPGRGAYLCRQLSCAELAVKQKKLARALAAPVETDLLEKLRAIFTGTEDA